jgi:Domain of unknown function (DUF397)
MPDSGLRWIKGSRSYSNGNCVEVTSFPDAHVGVRDSKSEGPILRFTPDEWTAFLEGARNGEFNNVAVVVITAGHKPQGGYMFLAGVRNGEIRTWAL